MGAKNTNLHQVHYQSYMARESNTDMYHPFQPSYGLCLVIYPAGVQGSQSAPSDSKKLS